MSKKKVVVMKAKKMPKNIEQCPNCGMERENDTDESEPVYYCMECGKGGFDCCVAGNHVICQECEEREQSEES
jgi:predicted RNA-binding Zn-ribbon protein involved in translation (DUF1610 family)